MDGHFEPTPVSQYVIFFQTRFRLRFHPGITVSVLPAPNHKICTIGRALPYKFAYWIPVIAFECLLFSLAFRVFLEDIFEIRQLRRWNGVSILNVILRDNIAAA